MDDTGFPDIPLYKTGHEEVATFFYQLQKDYPESILLVFQSAVFPLTEKPDHLADTICG